MRKISLASFLELRYFDNSLFDYAVFFIIVALSIVAGKIVYFISNKIVKKITAQTKTKLDDIIVDMLEEPFVAYIILIGIKIAFGFLSFPSYPKIPVYFSHLLYMALVLNTTWLITRFLDAIIEEYLKPFASETETDLDDHLIPIVKKLIFIVAYVMAGIMILHHFGQQIGPLLAGMGIGGLAFALAAKDMLSNLFGSLTILMDKPFTIGQRIKLSGYDGFVKEISLRTTRIETLDGTIIYVPNAKFTDSIVENVSQEWARKVKMTLGLVYDTTLEQMKKAKEIIHKVLDEQQGIDKEKRMVYFTEFGDFSKNILLIYWITDKDNIFPIRDKVNMRIMEEFEKHGLEFAFPTQTIELKKLPKSS